MLVASGQVQSSRNNGDIFGKHLAGLSFAQDHRKKSHLNARLENQQQICSRP